MAKFNILIMCKFNIQIVLCFLFLSFLGCNKKNNEDNFDSKQEFILLNSYLHSTNSFTEGLFIENNKIYESTGSPEELIETESVFGILNLNNGEIDVKGKLNKHKYFGEGIAKCDDKIFQLTYKNQVGFVYDSKTFLKIDTFKFDSEEGWGLTNKNNGVLIMSDGTNQLTFFDSKTFKVIKKLYVKMNNEDVKNLNELEYVNGFIYANVYTTNFIVKIDEETGNVVKSYDLNSLYTEALKENPNSLEMNGIAYDYSKKTFFITGKMWPKIFEIKFNE